MRIIECLQGSGEWWEARRGIITASAMDKIITPTGKPTESKTRRNYICKLLADTICLSPPFFTSRGRPPNPAMQFGIETEPEARRWYCMDKGLDVKEVGFILSDCGRWGCSPDGQVGERGGVEIKCPTPETHIGYLLDNRMPKEYLPQTHGQLIVTGWDFVDFLSYSPGLRPLLVTITPDEYTERLRAALEEFWTEYQAALRLVKEAA